MHSGVERRKPTHWQQINNFIPLLVLALVSWIAITVVDGKIHRAHIDEKLTSITSKLDAAKEALELHNEASVKAAAKIASIHHQEHVTMCVGCHDNSKRSK